MVSRRRWRLKQAVVLPKQGHSALAAQAGNVNRSFVPLPFALAMRSVPPISAARYLMFRNPLQDEGP